MTTAQALQSILGSLAVIFALAVQTWLTKRFGEKKAAVIESKLEEVHKVVNGNHEAALQRIDQLSDTLSSVGVAVPPHPPATEPGTA